MPRVPSECPGLSAASSSCGAAFEGSSPPIALSPPALSLPVLSPRFGLAYGERYGETSYGEALRAESAMSCW